MAFNSAGAGASQSSSYYPSGNQAFNSYAPGHVVSRPPQVSLPYASAPEAPPNAGGYPPQSYSQPASSYYPQASGYATSMPPNIMNPFPLPNVGRGFANSGGFDPEEEARIAEWQSAYTHKDDRRVTTGAATAVASTYRAEAEPADSGKKKTGKGMEGKHTTVLREGGGKKWQDQTLLEWDPTHPRLFVGNLAGEVTDDSLMKAFAKYASVQRTRVVRDKRTTKSKGYGFVSFSDTDDFFNAAKEMQGKYIGSHPVIIKRSEANIAPAVVSDKKPAKAGRHRDRKRERRGGGGGGGGGGDVASVSSAPNATSEHGRVADGAIRKPPKKGKFGGRRILG